MKHFFLLINCMGDCGDLQARAFGFEKAKELEIPKIICASNIIFLKRSSTPDAV